MLPRQQPFSATTSLRTALRAGGVEREADRIFSTCPSLRTVALQFCRFVSPFIELESGENLLEKAMADAVCGFGAHESQDVRVAIKVFIEALASHVDGLCGIRLSVQDDNGDWQIWQYDEPVFDWMAEHGRKAVLIRHRDEKLAKGPVLIKLLSYICKVRDLQMAHLNLAHLI